MVPTGAHHVQRPGNEREEVAGDGEAAEGVRRKEPRDHLFSGASVLAASLLAPF